MDEWATPAVASALWTSRDGTMERDKHGSFLKGQGKPPTLNAADALVRWDPWVRVNLGVTELTRDLVYKATPAHTYSVSLRNGATTTELVKLTRPDHAFFEKQLGFVQSWAELRDERALEILAQIDDQFAFIASATGLNVRRARWTMEWLTITVQFTIAVELMFKHAFACYRPVDLSPQVQPLITTPGHGTYPMGHGAQAFATVAAMEALLGITPAQPVHTQLARQARRFSVNRVVAGVHFPIDAPAGQMLGMTLGEYVACASGLQNVSCLHREFAPQAAGDDPANDYLGDDASPPNGSQTGSSIAVPQSDFLETMARLARAEWDV